MAAPSPRIPAAAAAALLIALSLASCSSTPRSELAKGWYELGNAYFDKAEWKKAGEAYSRALSYDPKLVGSSFNLARALAEAGDYPAALRVLDELAKADPGNARIIATRAYVQYKLGDAQAALKSYQALLDLDPYSADAIYNISLLRQAAGDRERAAEDLARLVAVKSDDAAAWILLAGIQADLGRRDEAIASYEAAKKLGKADAVALERLGLLYAEARRYAEAMEALAASTQADAKRAGAWFSLARLRLTVAEDGTAGLEALKKAIEAGFADKEAAAALLAEPNLVEREAATKLLADKGLVKADGTPVGPAKDEKAGAGK
jgi:tetratricopeptide (TPR) repeat protein